MFDASAESFVVGHLRFLLFHVRRSELAFWHHVRDSNKKRRTEVPCGTPSTASVRADSRGYLVAGFLRRFLTDLFLFRRHVHTS